MELFQLYVGKQVSVKKFCCNILSLTNIKRVGEKFMVYVDSLGIYVNKVEDLRDKVSEDIYEVIEHLSSVDTRDIEEKYFNLQDEFEVYESMLENYRSSFNEILDLVNKFDNELDELYDYVSDTKRINRKEILSSLKNIEIELIKNIINKL